MTQFSQSNEFQHLIHACNEFWPVKKQPRMLRAVTLRFLVPVTQ